MGDEVTTIPLWPLANFDDDEKDTVRQFLVGDKEGVELEWNEWGYDEDGGEGSVQMQYKVDPATVMIFIDREGLDGNSYIVADGRCIKQPWYCELVLNHYNISYDGDWAFTDDAVNIFENHAVPWSRFDALGKWDILDIWNEYQTDEEYSILDSLQTEEDTIYVSYSQDDYDDVRAEILALNPDEVVEDADEDGEEAEEEEDDAEEDVEEEEQAEEEE